MKALANRAAVVVAASLAVLLLLVLYGVGNLWVLRQGYVEKIDAIAPRSARLLGMLESAEELRAAESKAAAILEEVAYPALRDAATTGAAMQKDIREVMIEAGMSISGSQLLPRQVEQGFDRLTIEITAEGNTEALEQTLASLELMRPLVFVQTLNVKPARVSRRRTQGAQPVSVGDSRKVAARFKLVALRLKS